MAKKNNSKKEAPAACELAALKKRYAVRAAAGLCSGAALAALYVCSRSGFAALAVPFAAAALCIGLWALFARLVLCRMPHLLHKQFTQPILWALSVPAWLGSACLLLMLPVSFSGEAEEAVALSIMLLEAVLLAPAQSGLHQGEDAGNQRRGRAAAEKCGENPVHGRPQQRASQAYGTPGRFQARAAAPQATASWEALSQMVSRLPWRVSPAP